LRKVNKPKVLLKTGLEKKNDIQKEKTDRGILARQKRNSVADEGRVVHREMKRIQYRYVFL
jgi:hypothetical protein